MSRLRRISTIVAAVAGALLTGVGVMPTSQAGATTTPTVDAKPNTGVADGQVIAVTGAGFSAGATIAVIECQTGATGPSGCDFSTLHTTTATSTGTFSTPFIASRYINVFNVFPIRVDCAVAHACILGAANIANITQAASTPLTFNPKAPPPPPLVLGGTLDPTGTVVHKTGVATVSGTVTCNRPVFAFMNGELRQIYHRFIFSNYFFTTVLCTSSRNWSIQVQPGNGLFSKGGVSADVSLYGNVGGTFSSVALSGTITLHFANP